MRGKAFRRSPMSVTITSAKDHRYTDVNETSERITGWRRDEVVGRTRVRPRFSPCDGSRRRPTREDLPFQEVHRPCLRVWQAS